MTVGTGSPPGTEFTVVGVAKAYMVQVGGGPLPTEITGPLADRLVGRGLEVGTVTGRRRRVGWFDVPFVCHAVEVDGVSQLCLTNIDVLSGLDEVKVATHYEVDGRRFDRYPVSLRDAARVQPVLQTLDGWHEFDRAEVARVGYCALPQAAKDYIEFVSHHVGVPLAAIGVGRERAHTIWLDHGRSIRIDPNRARSPAAQVTSS